MLKFLKNISFFFLFIILFAVSSFALMYLAVNKFDNVTKFDTSKEILILGSSLTECSMNDEILNNAINLSFAADSYFWSYVKLNALTKNNKNIKTILLNIGYGSLQKKTKKILVDVLSIQEKLPRYFYLMDLEEIWFLFKLNPFVFIKSLLRVYK